MTYYVYHHNDADGRAACAIALRWIAGQAPGNVVVEELDYKDTPCFDSVGSMDTAIIVDFSFNPCVMQQLQRRTSNVVWCDHHKTAAAYGYDVAGLRDFSEKGLAGCEVTWKYFFPKAEVPYWIKLLGDYDAWRLQEENCFLFYEGLKLHYQGQDEDGVWRKLFKEGAALTAKIIAEGATAITYRDNYCQEMREAFGYETEIGGVKAYACNIYRFGSGGFGEMMGAYPLCISYAHDGVSFTVSLYSTQVDVGEIAKQHGGGGHKGAAGFVCDTLPFVRNKEVTK